MNALTGTKSPASIVRSKRRVLLSAAACALGGQFLWSTAGLAAPPAPDLDYAIAYGTEAADTNLYPTFYVQWETSNYSDPDLVDMQFYWGDNSTTVGNGAYFESDSCSAAETSQTFNVFEEQYNSSTSYEVGVQAYDDSGYSSVSWIGATNDP